MALRLLMLAVLTALTARASAAEMCPSGRASTLELRGEIPRIPTLQGGLGSTQITQKFADASKPPIVRNWPGMWSCLGVATASHAFVLLHRDVVGATPAYVGLTLIDDATGQLRALPFHALGHVVVAGPELRYAVAVLGAGQLVALDLTTLQVTPLGEAPAPMPLTPAEAKFSRSKKPLAWSRDPRDSTSELEPEILRFASPTTVLATFGKDTAQKRDAKRRTQTFDLTAPPPEPFLPTKDARRMPNLSK